MDSILSQFKPIYTLNYILPISCLKAILWGMEVFIDADNTESLDVLLAHAYQF
jgi:hypothetical protein